MKAWPTNYECEGQMTIADYLSGEPEILLKAGEHVWKVVLGDIFEYEVEDWTYLCGKGDRGYGLIDIESSTKDFHTYSRAWNSSLGASDFKCREDAERLAAQNLKKCEHILAKNMNAERIVAYQVEYRGHDHVDWYAELGNGLIYYQYGSMYDHIGTEKEIENFERKLYENRGNISWNEPVRLEDYQPNFKNMYKCKKENWLYAGAKYFGYMGEIL